MSEPEQEKPARDERRKEQEQDEQRSDALLISIMQPTCDLCGSLMLELHCRLICPMCGYQRDCSDP